MSVSDVIVAYLGERFPLTMIQPRRAGHVPGWVYEIRDPSAPALYRYRLEVDDAAVDGRSDDEVRHLLDQLRPELQFAIQHDYRITPEEARRVIGCS